MSASVRLRVLVAAWLLGGGCSSGGGPPVGEGGVVPSSDGGGGQPDLPAVGQTVGQDGAADVKPMADGGFSVIRPDLAVRDDGPPPGGSHPPVLPGPCMLFTNKCEGSALYACEPNFSQPPPPMGLPPGEWKLVVDCAASGGACSGDRCQGSCAGAPPVCSKFTGPLLVCGTGGTWETRTCPGQYCTDAACWECTEAASSSRPGETRCNGDTVQVCSADHRWQDSQACAMGCAGGYCEGQPCPSGARRCKGKELQACGAGTWRTTETCNFACGSRYGMPMCTGFCLPGARQCGPTNEAMLCDELGEWQVDKTCPFVCREGSCMGECAPGETRCNEAGTSRCGLTGMWEGSLPCPLGCSNGKCRECTPGEKRCLGNLSRVCGTDGTWKQEACPFICSDGMCAGECRSFERRCMGSTAQSCQEGKWVSTSCPFGCIEGACAQCSPGGSQCSSPTKIRSCTQTGVWGPEEECPMACVGNVCGGECKPGKYVCSGNSARLCSAQGTLGPAVTCGAACTTESGCCGGVGQGCCSSGPNSPSTCASDQIRCMYRCSHFTCDVFEGARCNSGDGVSRCEACGQKGQPCCANQACAGGLSCSEQCYCGLCAPSSCE